MWKAAPGFEMPSASKLYRRLLSSSPLLAADLPDPPAAAGLDKLNGVMRADRADGDALIPTGELRWRERAGFLQK